MAIKNVSLIKSSSVASNGEFFILPDEDIFFTHFFLLGFKKISLNFSNNIINYILKNYRGKYIFLW